MSSDDGPRPKSTDHKNPKGMMSRHLCNTAGETLLLAGHVAFLFLQAPQMMLLVENPRILLIIALGLTD